MLVILILFIQTVSLTIFVRFIVILLVRNLLMPTNLLYLKLLKRIKKTYDLVSIIEQDLLSKIFSKGYTKH